MVRAFSSIFLLSATKASLVQFAFYLGYGVTAIPAAILIQNTSYKTGLLLGLGLYSLGTLLFIPASLSRQFDAFLGAYFLLTCGLAFLEARVTPLCVGGP